MVMTSTYFLLKEGKVRGERAYILSDVGKEVL